MARNNPGREQREKNMAQIERDRLKQNLENIIVDRNWWMGTLADRRFREVIDNMKGEIDRQKDDLISAEPKEVPKLQAQIRAKQFFMGQLNEKTSEIPIQNARRALDQYEQDNALFLSADGSEAIPTPKQDNDDVAEAE